MNLSAFYRFVEDFPFLQQLVNTDIEDIRVSRLTEAVLDHTPIKRVDKDREGEVILEENSFVYLILASTDEPVEVKPFTFRTFLGRHDLMEFERGESVVSALREVDLMDVLYVVKVNEGVDHTSGQSWDTAMVYKRPKGSFTELVERHPPI